MKTEFRTSFDRDLKKIGDPTLLERIQEMIEQVEAAGSFQEITHVKKLRGKYFRVRVGNYRIGVGFEKDTVEFIRCLPRKDLYRNFP
jgi:mRNA interferase RelE/StbE